MLAKLKTIEPFIGNTPTRRIYSSFANLYAKLEYYNYSGSIKDRPAYNIMLEGIKAGLINQQTTIVESSSGNFAVALASICKVLGLNFIPVIDPNINQDYESLLRLLCHKVVKVTEADHTGGYLLTRIKTVQSIISENDNSFWPDQYSNPNNYISYYNGLGVEICEAFEKLDYVFVGVSSAGTITGLSRRLKEKFPCVKIVAVDIEGSVIFGQKPKQRRISGIGASKVPPILPFAMIDEVVHVSEADIVKGCYELLDEQMIFGGGSSGAVYFAAKRFLEGEFGFKDLTLPSALIICPDKGQAYLNTIFNNEWLEKITSHEIMANVSFNNYK